MIGRSDGRSHMTYPVDFPIVGDGFPVLPSAPPVRRI